MAELTPEAQYAAWCAQNQVTAEELAELKESESLDLDEAAERLERMSQQLHDALAELENMPDLEAAGSEEVGESAAASREAPVPTRPALGAATCSPHESSAGISKDDVDELSARAEGMASALQHEMTTSRELRELHDELERENASRSQDCEAALAELNKLKTMFDMLTGGHVDEALLTGDAPAPTADQDHQGPALHREDAPTAEEIEEATPTEEEAIKMTVLLNKLKADALLVEQNQLKQQIAELEAMKNMTLAE